MNQNVLHPSDFYIGLAKSRAWIFINKNLNRLGLICIGAIALAMLQITLSFAFPEMRIMYISYFSFAMNVTLVVLALLCLIAYAGSIFLKDFKFTMFEDETIKQLQADSISVAPDILVMNLSADESTEGFAARIDQAFKEAGPQQWVLAIAFRHYSFQVKMDSDIGQESAVGYFLRSKPFEDVKPTINDVAENIKQFSNESFDSYVTYCRVLAKDFKVWSATEKIGRTNPFTNAAEWLRTQAVFPVLILFVSLPLFVSAQKTKQVEQYLGDRATVETPVGKEVSFVFDRREISVISQGKDYLETLKSVPFFQDAQDAGRLVLIKVDGEKILPKPPAKKAVAKSEFKAGDESALPIPEETPGASFLDRLPDSTELQVMKNAHLRDKAKEWKSIHPVLDYYMWRFWGLFIIVFCVGGIMWVLARVSAKDSLKDVYGNAFLGNAITQMHIFSKTFLFVVMAIPTVVILLDDAIRMYYTSVFSIGFMIKYFVIYWVWQWVFEKVLPDSPGQTSRSTGGYPTNHRQLNG